MKKNSLKTNLIYNTLYQITLLILPFLTAPYISRIIEPDGIGIFSYSHSVAIYFIYFAMLGISNYGNREIAKNSDKPEKLSKIFSSIYSLQIITSTIVSIVYFIYIYSFNQNYFEINFIIYLYIFSTFFDVSWLFFGLQEFKITSITQIITRILCFISILIFVKTKEDLWIYTLIMSISYLIPAIVLWILMFKKIKIVKCKFKDILKLLKPCLILFIPIIATSIYRLMDKIMIGNFSNMSEVGFYENAEKIILISLGILNAFTAVMMPKISNLLSKNKKDKADELLNKSMEIAMFICFALSFGIAAISTDFIPLFFGKGYEKSILICSLLCISVPFITCSTIIRNLYLITHEEDKIYVKSVLIGAVVNFVINLIFIPKYAALGAVIGTILAEISLSVYQIIKIKNSINIKLYIKYLSKFFVIGLIMFIGIILSHYITLNFKSIIRLSAEILTGIFIYILLSFFYFYKNNNDFKNVLMKRIKNKGGE